MSYQVLFITQVLRIANYFHKYYVNCQRRFSWLTRAIFSSVTELYTAEVVIWHENGLSVIGAFYYA